MNKLGNEFMEMIERYPDKPWCWSGISNNPNITMEIIDKYPDKPWNWSGISSNPNLTMDIIEKYPNKPLHWYCWISRNPNLTMEIIEKYPDKPWDWDRISSNPNLTIEMIEKHLDKPWDWNVIASNGLNYKERYLTEARRHLAALRIQKHWMKARYNPAYKMCRYLFFKQIKEPFTENGYDYPMDEENKEDIGDW